MYTARVPKVEDQAVKHQYYCDRCGSFIGSSFSRNGAKPEPVGEFKESICVDGDWYTIDVNLCDRCRDRLVSAISDAYIKASEGEDLATLLLGLGFNAQ